MTIDGMRIILTLTTVVAIFSLFLSCINFITFVFMTKDIKSVFEINKFQNSINEEVREELNTSFRERKEIAQALNKLFELRERDVDRLFEALSQIELLKQAVNMKKDIAEMFNKKNIAFTTFDIELESEERGKKISLETDELQKTGTSE